MEQASNLPSQANPARFSKMIETMIGTTMKNSDRDNDRDKDSIAANTECTHAA
jgi:hypothetical protein